MLLSENLVHHIMRQLFQATEYMHRQGICHRDLKPDNLMIKYYRPLKDDDNSSQASGSENEPIKMQVIDLNVAIEAQDQRIQFATGLKEWSAPETSKSQHFYDFKIDTWTLGCVMFFICTGNQPFSHQETIHADFNFWLLMKDYQDSQTYPEMVDFLSKLVVMDPANRMTSIEALSHPWMNSLPY